MIVNITPEQLIKLGYREHHTATERGYISRKIDHVTTEYNGRFGSGYKVHYPRFDTNNFHYVTYYVK